MTTLNANAVISNSSLTLKDKYFRNFITDDDDTCMDVAASCNCYSKLRFPLQDTIRITDMNKLPVTGFAYGPFTSDNAQAAIRVKELECFGCYSIPPKITRDDCGAVNLKSTNRLQLDMEFVTKTKGGKDCYAEITFMAKINLKLTVSSLSVSMMTCSNDI